MKINSYIHPSATLLCIFMDYHHCVDGSNDDGHCSPLLLGLRRRAI